MQKHKNIRKIYNIGSGSKIVCHRDTGNRVRRHAVYKLTTRADGLRVPFAFFNGPFRQTIFGHFRSILTVRKPNPGFSLVEMLMALLVASLLMAALAPVMTRRFHENLSVSGSTGGIIPKTFCAYVNDGTELRIIDDEKTGCIVPENTFSMNVIMASGGGGGGGAVDMAVSTDLKTMIENQGANSSSNNFTVTEKTASFDKSTKQILIKMSGAGAGGGGGNYDMTGWEPSSQTDCGNWGIFLTKAQNGGKAACVSKFNPGENRTGSPNIPSTVQQCAAGYNDAGGCANNTKCTSDANCCWYGNNDSGYKTVNDTCDAANGGYSGCYRTVCQWNAADTICKNWNPASKPISGRLPTLDELKAWADNINTISVGRGSNGLQLCEYDSKGYNSATCYYVNGNPLCSGGTYEPVNGYKYGVCRPDVIWSSDTIGSIGYRFARLMYGKLEFSDYSNNDKAKYLHYAQASASVRCVLGGLYFTSRAGGGGSAGTYIEINVPQNIISLATQNNNARIVTRAGAGGEGGNGAQSDSAVQADKGVGGAPSWVGIYDGTILLWSVSVPGGNPGSGAKKDSGGSEGSKTTSKCTYYDSTSADYNVISGGKGKEVDCEILPNRTSTVLGEAGISGDTDLNTGLGGRGYWAGSYGARPVLNSGSTSISGGGSGGSCEQDGETTTCYPGGSGAGGKIQAFHSPTYPGSAGGGGGAGVVAYIKNIQVRPNDFIKVQIGHGGNGGSIGLKGIDGGSSYIDILRDGVSVSKYEILGGSGGNPGIKGDPDNNQSAKAGTGGDSGKLSSGTKILNEDFWPKTSEDKEKAKGLPGIPSEDELTSPGGNGGINPKISILAKTDGELNGTPCGGLSQTEIKINDENVWNCINPSNIPLPLSRSLTDGLFTSEILKNLAPGSTGGGGGGWKYGATPAASGGAKGMGGYVYIYFGDWGEGG